MLPLRQVSQLVFLWWLVEVTRQLVRLGWAQLCPVSFH